MFRNRRLEIVAGLLLMGLVFLSGYSYLGAGMDAGSQKPGASPPPSPTPTPFQPAPPPPQLDPLPPLDRRPIHSPTPLPTAPAVSVKDMLWTFKLDVQEGKTNLWATVKKSNLEVRISCDAIDVQVPRGKLLAQGKVKVTAPRLEATCDTLTINLQEDLILLEGKAQIIQGQFGQEMEVKGDRLHFRLNQPSPAPAVPSKNARIPISKD